MSFAQGGVDASSEGGVAVGGVGGKQRADYRAIESQLYEQYSAPSCQVASDCHRYQHPIACGVQECDIAIRGTQLEAFQAALDAYAKESCNPACPVAYEGHYESHEGEGVAGAGPWECDPTALGCPNNRCWFD